MQGLADRLDLGADKFETPGKAREVLQSLCASNGAPAEFVELGRSEEDRPIDAVVLGDGPARISLIAGNHSDEPVGPEFLRRFAAQVLAVPASYSDLLSRCTFHIIPHTNPDGEAINRSWMEVWPDVTSYLSEAFREPPGRDMEFGFPAMRKENGIVGDFLRDRGPFDLHMSLHGMGFGEGVMLLIERTWAFRTQALRDGFAKAARDQGLSLHDHNRKGEKGFFYIEPGFSTTPEGEAMRWFFRAQQDDAMADRFHQSSMEFVRSLGGDPLCIVTELPLFVLPPSESGLPGIPSTYLSFRRALPDLQRRLAQGEDAHEELSAYGIRPLSLRRALRMQAVALDLSLTTALKSASKCNV